MHDTALEFGRLFFETYTKRDGDLRIVDIGAQDVCGSLRSVAPAGNRFIGVDVAPGNGVDVILADPYALPFEDDSVDVCVSSSCFEHSEFFWLLFLEILRILKPNGLFYLNAPSRGSFHRYPVDCWRFYPDSGVALQNWARRSGLDALLLESFVGTRRNDIWNDYIAVFVKDGKFLSSYPRRIQDTVSSYTNGYRAGSQELSRFTPILDDRELPLTLRAKRLVRSVSDRIFGRRKRGEKTSRPRSPKGQ